MSWFVVAVVVIVVVLALLGLLARRGASVEHLPYSKASALFSPAERSFFGVLTQAVGKDFCVFGKVRVADVLTVNGGLAPSARTIAQNRINSKHFDFVLCAPTDLSVLCVIELNDASHAQKKRQDRDDFLAAACNAARLPLVVFPARAAYSPAELSRQIAEALVLNDAGALGRDATTTGAQNPVKSTGSAAATASETQPAPLCPKCSSPMTRRTVTSGSNAGKEFWGCSRYPNCRGVFAA
jgi:hypothetical protein